MTVIDRSTHLDTSKRAKLLNMTPEQMVKEFQDVVGDQKPHLYRALILEEVEEFNEAYLTITTPEEEVFKELLDILYVTFGFAVAKGWNVTEGFRRVHENNKGRMLQDDGTIKRREDGKVIKNKNYHKVDLSDLV